MPHTNSTSPATVKAEADTTPPFAWRKHLPVHPAAELFPLMRDTDPAGFAALDENIRVNGLQSSIVLFCENGKERVLDGRNRLDALARSGRLYFDGGRVQIEHHPGDTFHPFTYRHAQSADVAVGCDPYAFVLSANIHRRHLTPALKDELIAAVLKVKSELSNRQIGVMTGTNKNKVGAVRTKLEATGQIGPVEKTVGKDKKARKKPVKKAKPKVERDEIERDRQTCVALYQKVKDAERAKAQWLADHPHAAAEPQAVETTAKPEATEPEKPAEPIGTTTGIITEEQQPTPAPLEEQFAAHVRQLIRLTKGRLPQYFLKTAVPNLHDLAVFMTELAALQSLSADATAEAAE